MRELTQQFLGRRPPGPRERPRASGEGPRGRPDLHGRLRRPVRGGVDRVLDEGERRAFLDTLGMLAADDGGRHHAGPGAARRLPRAPRRLEGTRGDGRGEHGPRRGADLPTMSAAGPSLPALRAGLVFDDGLVDALVSDAGAEPGLLPLLSTALAQLWEERAPTPRHTSRPLRAPGGPGQRYARHLAESHGRRPRAGGARAPCATSDEARRSGRGDLATRRRVPPPSWRALRTPSQRVGLRWSPARLLTREGDAVGSHTRPCSARPRLRNWLREDAPPGARCREGLPPLRRSGTSQGREAGMLWSGSRLAAATELAEPASRKLTGLELGVRRCRPGRRSTPLGSPLSRRPEGKPPPERPAAVPAARRGGAARGRAGRRLRSPSGREPGRGLRTVGSGSRGRRGRQAPRRERARSLEYPDLVLPAAVEATRLSSRVRSTYGALLTPLSRQPAGHHPLPDHEPISPQCRDPGRQCGRAERQPGRPARSGRRDRKAPVHPRGLGRWASGPSR